MQPFEDIYFVPDEGLFFIVCFGSGINVYLFFFYCSPKAKMDIFQLLIEIDPYCRLNPQCIANLSVSFFEKTYQPGETFYDQGRPVEGFAIIRSGSTHVSVMDSQGAELSCGTLRQGDIVFDLALLTGMAATASVTCLEPTALWCQSKLRFFESLSEHPHLKNFFYRNIATAISQYHDLNCSRHRIQKEVNGSVWRCAPNLRKALAFIEQNYKNPITLEMVAKETATSKFHFSRLFKQHTGLSFKQYLNRKRIEAAKELLAQREYNITEVGYAVGFNDASYFSRVFREVEGCSPRDHLISKDYFA